MKVLVGRDRPPRRNFVIRWLWEPRDMWIGIFWNRVYDGPAPQQRYLFVYVCLLPCLPLVFIRRLT